MSVNVFLYSVSGFWTCVKISPPKKPNTASKTSFIRRSNRRLSFECFQDRHDARHEKCDQEDRDDYLCADSFPCGIRLLARTNYHIPACHYPVKLSEEITHDSARPDFHCLLGRLLHVSPFVLTLICTVTKSESKNNERNTRFARTGEYVPAAFRNQPSRFTAWRLFVRHSLKSPMCSCVSITLPASS